MKKFKQKKYGETQTTFYDLEHSRRLTLYVHFL